MEKTKAASDNNCRVRSVLHQYFSAVKHTAMKNEDSLGSSSSDVPLETTSIFYNTSSSNGCMLTQRSTGYRAQRSTGYRAQRSTGMVLLCVLALLSGVPVQCRTAALPSDKIQLDCTSCPTGDEYEDAKCALVEGVLTCTCATGYLNTTPKTCELDCTSCPTGDEYEDAKCALVEDVLTCTCADGYSNPTPLTCSSGTATTTGGAAAGTSTAVTATTTTEKKDHTVAIIVGSVVGGVILLVAAAVGLAAFFGAFTPKVDTPEIDTDGAAPAPAAEKFREAKVTMHTEFFQ